MLIQIITGTKLVETHIGLLICESPLFISILFYSWDSNIKV